MEEHVAAVDLGGTLTKIALVAADGSVQHERSVPTVRRYGPEGTVDGLIAELRTTIADRSVVGFGVVVPGVVDAVAGVVRAATNLDWYDLPLRDRLTAGLGLPGAVAHDVRSAGLAEWRLGGYAGFSDLVFVSLGTGIAAAVITDGRLVDAGGYAGELGHIRVPAAGDLPCPCGQTGCLETVASAAGLARTYARFTSAAPTPTPLGEVVTSEPRHADPALPTDHIPAGNRTSATEPAPPATAVEVADAARAGDPAARAALDLATTALTEGLTTAVTLFGPEVVVLGGGLSGAADLLLPALQRGLNERLTFQRRPRLAAAALGSRAGLIGAGLVGWDAVADGPVA